MLSNQRHLFSLPEELSYLNNAYMAPNLKTVEEAGVAAVRRKNQPHLIKPSDFFEPAERLRADLATLIDSPDAQQVVLIPSVSYGMAVVAHNLPLQKGENIVISEEQFPSNVYPWMRLCEERGAELRRVAAPAGPNRGKAWTQAILEAIDSKTRLVSTGHIHWADGTLLDLKAIRKRSREAGAWMAIDGTQSVGALPFSVREIQPDALVCGAYKWLMGPYSIGMAYFGPALNEGKPLEENWMNRLHAEDFANLVNYQDAYQPGALRYEVGEHSNFTLLPMFQAAVTQLLKWQPEHIQDYCKALSKEPLAYLAGQGISVAPPEQRVGHLFGLRLPSGPGNKAADKETIKKRLEEQQVLVSFRGDAIRVSCHLYNTAQDFEKLIDCIGV